MYTREQLEKGYNFHALKDILVKLGGIPSNKNKEQIIDLILDIQDGKVEIVPKGKGRKRNDEKWENIEYQDDDHKDVIVGDNEDVEKEYQSYVSGDVIKISGTFEKSEGYDHGFLRGENFKMSSATDVYVSANSVRYFHLRQGDYIEGTATYNRDNNAPGLKAIEKINKQKWSPIARCKFQDLEPAFPDSKIKLEVEGENDITLRAIDLLAPIGKGQRGLIVAPPKAGKTTLLKKMATSINKNHPDIHLMVLLIGERPEEVTDFKRSINCELIYSTFDEKPKNHIRISELAIEKAKRMVEAGEHVVILLDSITKLTRAYNETISSSGKTLSGGIDPIALQQPKSFFGAARNIDGGGSLTIISTALVETGSRMDDVIYEEFKGTGNSEIILSRSLSERRIFPAIDLYRSGTRKDELLLSQDELDCAYAVRRYFDKINDAEVKFIDMIKKTANNSELTEKAPVWFKLMENN